MENKTIDLNIEGITIIHENMPFLVPYLICYSLTTIGGGIGNLLLMGTIIANKQLHTSATMLIFNLATIDFFLCTFVGSFSILG